MNVELNEEGYTLDSKYRLVPTNPDHSSIKAMAESKAIDDEGEYECIMDLIDFSGENKLHTALRFAYFEAVDKAPKPEINNGLDIIEESLQSTGRYFGYLYCRHCGAEWSHFHLPNCPTLKSKL